MTFHLVDPQTASGKTKTLFEALQAKLGMVPNLARVLANAPQALEAYLSFNGALGTTLDARLRERIALLVAQDNGCDYCLSAHSLLGKGAGLKPEEILAARHGEASTTRDAAALHFARALIAAKGRVAAEDVAALKAAGFNEGEVIAVVANVVVNIFTNYVNLVAATPIDFPVVNANAA